MIHAVIFYQLSKLKMWMTFNFKSFSPFCLLCTDRMYRIPLIIKKNHLLKNISRILTFISSLHFSVLYLTLSLVSSCLRVGLHSFQKKCCSLSVFSAISTFVPNTELYPTPHGESKLLHPLKHRWDSRSCRSLGG